MPSHGYSAKISSFDVVQGIPSGKPQVCKGRRLLQVLGAGGSYRHCCNQFNHTDLFTESILVQDAQPLMQIPRSGERTFYYKLLDVLPSFLCGLLQIGPDLGTYLLPCVDPSVEWLFCTGSQRILLPAPIMLTGC